LVFLKVLKMVSLKTESADVEAEWLLDLEALRDENM
jgi:hypothetical protein